MVKKEYPAEKINAVLSRLSAVDSLDDVTGYFYDEPKFYQYRVILETYLPDLRPEHVIGEEKITSSGCSCSSSRQALIRCMAEAAERLSLTCFFKKRIQIVPLSHVDRNLCEGIQSASGKIGAVEGENIITGAKVLIPARSVFLSYPRYAAYYLELGERYSRENISTGAACGINKNNAVLQGLFEVFERDAYLGAYLTGSTPFRIRLKNIKNSTIERMVESMERYDLRWEVLDVTNDLGVPSFVSVIIDETGVGPALNIGLKSDFNKINAVIGSCEEAMLGRYWTRIHMLSQKHPVQTKKTKIANHIGRSMHWFNRSMLPIISFFMKGAYKDLENTERPIPDEHKISKMKEAAVRHKVKMYTVDATLESLKKTGLSVQKSIIPALQPLYLAEQYKVLKKERLKNIARFFGQKKMMLNTVPYPF